MHNISGYVEDVQLKMHGARLPRQFASQHCCFNWKHIWLASLEHLHVGTHSLLGYKWRKQHGRLAFSLPRDQSDGDDSPVNIPPDRNPPEQPTMNPNSDLDPNPKQALWLWPNSNHGNKVFQGFCRGKGLNVSAIVAPDRTCDYTL